MIDGRATSATSALPSASLGTGTEWIVDVYGCSPDSLNNVPAARDVCEKVVAELDLKVVAEPHWHRFPEPGGVTGMYLLSESHLTCHTYPEFGFATFNLYCCRRRETWDWEAQLAQMLGATRVCVRQIDRGREILDSEEANLLRGGSS